MKKKYILTATTHLTASKTTDDDVVSYFVNDTSVKHPGVEAYIFKQDMEHIRVIEGRTAAIAIIGIMVGHLGRPNTKNKYVFRDDVNDLFGDTSMGNRIGTITLQLVEVTVDKWLMTVTDNVIAEAVLEAEEQFNGEAKVRIKSVDLAKGVELPVA